MKKLLLSLLLFSSIGLSSFKEQEPKEPVITEFNIFAEYLDPTNRVITVIVGFSEPLPTTYLVVYKVYVQGWARPFLYSSTLAAGFQGPGGEILAEHISPNWVITGFAINMSPQ